MSIQVSHDLNGKTFLSLHLNTFYFSNHSNYSFYCRFRIESNFGTETEKITSKFDFSLSLTNYAKTHLKIYFHFNFISEIDYQCRCKTFSGQLMKSFRSDEVINRVVEMSLQRQICIKSVEMFVIDDR